MLGCSHSKNARFNDDNIKINLMDSQSNDEFRTYTIEVKNEGQVELRGLNFFIYYPILQPNGSKGNPFKLEGKTELNKPVNIKPGMNVIYTVFAPIKEVFGDSKLLDFNNPQIELNGFVEQGKEDVPFSMSGGYIRK